MEPELPEEIPLFPLSGALLLPDARLPLNVFEPRYIEMIDDVLATKHRLIGVLQPKAVSASNAEKNDLYQIGCVGRLISFSETVDDRYLIGLNGFCRFQILEELEGPHSYRRAIVDYNPFLLDLKEPEITDSFNRPALMRAFETYIAKKQLEVDREALELADSDMLINALSMLLPFGDEEKQALLESFDINARAKTLQALMTFGAATNTTAKGSLQ